MRHQKLNTNLENCAFRWFVSYNYITMHGANNIKFTTTGVRTWCLPISSVNLYMSSALVRYTSNLSISAPWMYLYKQRCIERLLHHHNVIQHIQTLYVVLRDHFVMFCLSHPPLPQTLDFLFGLRGSTFLHPPRTVGFRTVLHSYSVNLR